MLPISEVDQNFNLGREINKDDIRFYNVLSDPFRIDGVIVPKKEGEPFFRMPPEVANEISPAVSAMNYCTSGGRVRFKTDSPYVAVHLEISVPEIVGRYSHMPNTSSFGMDLYEYRNGKEHYVMTFVPPVDFKDHYESCIDFPDSSVRELTINMPLYSGVTNIFVGIRNTAQVLPCRSYSHELPVVYYGSSITQGGCASRPGNSYQAMISRRLDCNYINLGFSAAAMGELGMAEYIGKLPMKAFVMDYDANAPTPEYLEMTHEPFYKRVRQMNPDLPIIMVTRPYSESLTGWLADDDAERRVQIVKRTYNAAIAAGDLNVYFVDGRDMVSHIPDCWGVDLWHPNDLGFHGMATAIGDTLVKIL